MHFDLDTQQAHFRQAALEFGVEHVAPTVARRDHDAHWDEALFSRMGKAGLLGAVLPRSHGGGGGGALDFALMQEGFGEGSGDAGLSFAWGVHTVLCGMRIAWLGNEAQRRRYLPPMCSGEQIAGFSFDQAPASPTAQTTKIRARKQADRWLLDGRSSWVVNGPIANHFVVRAATDAAAGIRGMSTFVVDRSAPGLRVRPTVEPSGLRTAMVAELLLDGCELPEESLLGGSDHALDATRAVALNWQRSCLIAHWLGLMHKIAETSEGHVKERSGLATQAASLQSARAALADMRIGCQLSRKMLYRAAWSIDRGGSDASRHAIAAWMFVSGRIPKIMRDGMDVVGWTSAGRGTLLERCHRDSMFVELVGGSGRHMVASALAGHILGTA